MSDEFLYRLRQPPRPEFAEALYERIRQEPKRPPLRRRVALGLTGLAVVFALALLCFPSVREAVAQGIRIIGGIWFYEAESLPRPTKPEIRLIPPVSLEEARAAFPCELALPEWLPEGLELRSVQVDRYTDEAATAILMWSNAYGETPLTMFIFCPAQEGQGPVIPPDAVVEEVKVNGQPAAVVYGKWINHQWEPRAWPVLYWRSREVVYEFASGSPQITVETLVRIAGSVSPQP